MISVQKSLLILFVFLACLFRLFAVYPPPLGYDPATIAIQASRIWHEGERPIFWTGQPFMGTIGMYVEALLFQCFGMNTLTLSFFAWGMNVLWILLTVLLAWRLFGLPTALGTAFLWIFPTERLLYWASTARPDYEICFLLTPLVLLQTHQLIRKHQQKSSLGFPAFLLGLVCGLGFWNNMALGPVIVVCVALLFLHLKSVFWTRFLPFFLPGALLGFMPVLIYNFQTDFVIFHQAQFHGKQHFWPRIYSFFTLAFPDLWGIRLNQIDSAFWRSALTLFLWSMAGIYLAYGWQLYRRWKQNQDLLGDQLIVCFYLFLIGFTTFTNFGKRFLNEIDSTLYITTIYTVLFLIPARLASFFGWRGKLLCYLPFLLYIGHNLSVTGQVPEKCINRWRNEGFHAIRHFPDFKHPFIPFCETNHLELGYVDSSIHQFLNIQCLPRVTFVNPFEERHLPYALRADAAKNIFWVRQEHDLNDQFDRLGCQYRESRVKNLEVFYDFKKELIPESLVSDFTLKVSGPYLHSSFLNDRHIGTTWGNSEDEEAFIEWHFSRPERLTHLVFIPKNSGSVPERFDIQTSQDGKNWETISRVKDGRTYFWSLYHPYVKRVKPRMEIALPALSTQYLRVSISKNNPCRLAEVYVYKNKTVQASPLPTMDQEIDQIEKEIQTHFKEGTLVGDHWWMNHLHLKGFKTHFLSNHSIDKYGLKSPHLETKVPLPQGMPYCFIVSSAHVDSVRNFFEKHRVSFSHKAFAFHELFYVETLPDSPSLHWDGLDVNEIAASQPKTGFSFPYPPLRSLVPDAKDLSLRFGDEFSIPATQVERIPEGFRFACEIIPLASLKKDFFLYLHFYSAEGRLLFQGDLKLEHFGKTTRFWAPGQRVLLERVIAVPKEHLGKDMEVRFGIWHPESEKQLRLEGSEARYCSIPLKFPATSSVESPNRKEEGLPTGLTPPQAAGNAAGGFNTDDR